MLCSRLFSLHRQLPSTFQHMQVFDPQRSIPFKFSPLFSAPALQIVTFLLCRAALTRASHTKIFCSDLRFFQVFRLLRILGFIRFLVLRAVFAGQIRPCENLEMWGFVGLEG